MNLVIRYMERLVWGNTYSVDIYLRKDREIQEAMLKFMGAPEAISHDKRFAITIKFKKSLDPYRIQRFLHGEYDSIEFKCGDKIVTIKDAAIIYKRVEDGRLLIEMNAVEIETHEWTVV